MTEYRILILSCSFMSKKGNAMMSTETGRVGGRRVNTGSKRFEKGNLMFLRKFQTFEV